MKNGVFLTDTFNTMSIINICVVGIYVDANIHKTGNSILYYSM